MGISIAAEIARANVKKKEIADLLGIQPAVLSRKLSQNNFSINEAEKVFGFLGYSLEIKKFLNQSC